MKKLMMVAVLITSTCAVAAPVNVPVNKHVPKAANLSPEERAARKAKFDALRMERVGGYVIKPGSQNGEIVCVNCQKRVPRKWLDETTGYFAEETRFKVSSQEGAFDFASPEIHGNASLFVIDDEKFPAILVAPENRWALVNVAVIAKENRPAFFEARVKKQIVRAFALLCGASDSQYPRSLTRSIVDESELDKNPDYRLPVDVVQRFKSYMGNLGVTPSIQYTYRKAVQEGWAPKPANEHQQRIWNELHEIPSEPIKIKPENHPAK